MKRVLKLIESKETLMYKGKEVQLVQIDDSDILTYRITMSERHENGTRDRIEKVDRSNIDEFIRDLLSIEPDQRSSTEVALSINSAVAKADKLFNSLSVGLSEDFEKLKDNADYVPVAKQRSETVKTILNITKTQIDIIKLEKLK